MFNLKRLSLFASLLLLIGLIGSLFTYKLLPKPETLTEEINIADNDFTNIEISTNDGQIELVSTREKNARIEVSGYDLHKGFSTEIKESTLVITSKESFNKLYNMDFTRKSTTVKVYVPEKNYHMISLHARNGKVTAKGITTNKLNLVAKDGLIDLQNIHSDTLTVNASNGRIIADTVIGSTFDMKAKDGKITLKNIAADTVSLVSRNGKIEIEELTGALSAQAKDGRINLVTPKLDDPIHLSTQNGKIHIITSKKPENTEIQAEARNGSITLFGEKVSHLEFGTGENKIDLSAKDGRIIIEEQ